MAENTTEFSFIIEKVGDNFVRVQMVTKGVEFYDLVNAAQYLMWQISRQSDVSFDETMEKLIQGAKSYHDMLRIVPKEEE